VVAGGQDVDVHEEVLADVLGDAAAAGGVLAVGDDHGRRIFLDERGQELVHGPAARPPDDVAEEEDPELSGHTRPPSSPG